MRTVVLDTETTGLSREDDRVVEIGCVEMVDMVPTGKTYHQYINPQRRVSKEAYAIHGLGDSFLKTKPTFRRIVDKFLKFVEGAEIVAHNATFDIGMLNAELDRLGIDPLENEVIDTLAVSRLKRPRKKHSLDALCSEYNIDNSRRTKHGALLDAEILAEVYVELCGGRQIGMRLELEEEIPNSTIIKTRQRPTPLPSRVTPEDMQAHTAFIQELGDDAIWREYR